MLKIVTLLFYIALGVFTPWLSFYLARKYGEKPNRFNAVFVWLCSLSLFALGFVRFTEPGKGLPRTSVSLFWDGASWTLLFLLFLVSFANTFMRSSRTKSPNP